MVTATAIGSSKHRLRGEQLKQLREIFRLFDLDGHNSLMELKLAALPRSLGLRNLSSSGDGIHALLAAKDADGNSTVEFDELATALVPPLLSPASRPVHSVVDHSQFWWF